MKAILPSSHTLSLCLSMHVALFADHVFLHSVVMLRLQQSRRLLSLERCGAMTQHAARYYSYKRMTNNSD